jgi:tetratricopeptide (TPR) repeat protein/SAM-dependent methyltransferase
MPCLHKVVLILCPAIIWGSFTAVATAIDLLQEGLLLHRQGAVAEAAARYSALLQAEPRHADAHYYLGLIACQQGRFADGAECARHALDGDPNHALARVLLGRAFAALGRNEEALASFDRALALEPDVAQVHGHRADVLSDLGRHGEAVEAYDRALAAAPDRSDDWFNRAVALNALGRRGDAITSLERAIACKRDFARAQVLRATLLSELGCHGEALQAADAAVKAAPNSAEAWFVRARMSMAAGNPAAAIEDALRSLELGETTETKALLANALRANAAIPDNRRRSLLERALCEGWLRPHDLIDAAIAVIKRDARANDCIARAAAAWPARLPPTEVLAAARTAALAQDRLFCRALQCAPVTDVGLERLLANIRHAMLARCTSDETSNEALLSLCCAVARQCFINEYVFSPTDEEAEKAGQLRASLEQALAAGASCPASWPVVVGSYFPLHSVQNAVALPKRSWPACVKELLVQQVEEPLHERRLAATIPALTDIGDGVRAIRQQYEENPYPRWIDAGPPAVPAALTDRPRPQPLDVLVAGCGTGLTTIELARARPKARILAIDLSLASLAYAKRMAERFNLSNVEFGQADIMKGANLGRQFDFIDASGVLHHLADPWAGWRVLLSLLRPDGVMQVGLYSAAARRNVVAIREMIAQHAYSPTTTDIRRCREEIIASPDGSLLKSVTAWSDFFAVSGCRDLLFHVQERRMTLLEIKSFVMANDLQFTGFILPAAIMQRFRVRFPDPSASTDLDCWHAYECDASATFAGMYQFGVRKSG